MANPFALTEIQGGTQQDSSNPYSISTIQGDARAEVRGSLLNAMDANPEQAAKAAQLARKVGAPMQAVQANLPEVERTSKLDDYERMLAGAPKLQEFLRQPENAQIAHDDVENMGALENTLKSWSGPKASIASVLGGLGESLKFKPLVSGLQLALHDAFFDDGSIDSQVRRADLIRKAGQAQAQQDYASPEFESKTARGIYSGGVSLVQNTPGIVASILTGNPAPALALAGLNTGAPAYSKYVERGANKGMAALGALGEGGVEVATELLPMGFLVSRFGKVGAKEFLAGMLGREIPSEQIATILQDAIDTAVANPDKTWGQYLEERPDAAYQTLLATLVQSGVMGGAHTIATRMQRRQEEAQGAEQGAEYLAKLNELAAASKVLQRDPETFASFVAQASEDGPVQDVFIDAKVLAQSGMAEQLAAVSPSVAEQLNVALQTGGDIRIPVAEYTANIAPTQYAQSLVDHLKVEPEGFSRAEAQEFMKHHAEELRLDVERYLAEKEGDDTFKASAETVKNEIKAQLDQANRFTPQVNDAYAAMVSNFYAVTAAKAGTTPEAMFQQYPLHVQATPVDGMQYAQGKLVTDTPAFQNWFGDSKVVDAEGNPLVVYHGTNKDFSEFRPSTRGALGPGIYLTTSTKEAGMYTNSATPGGEQVMPVYVNVKNPLYVKDGENVFDLLGASDDNIAEVLKDKGYDGIVLDRVESAWARKVMIDAGMEPTGDSRHIVVFNPEQIKSATGNRGTFDPNDPNILNQGGRLPVTLATFAPDTNTITLLQNANLSSFLHESAHFFLEVMTDLASRPDAPVQLRQDMDTVLQWFGLKDLAEWTSLDFEERRAYHERFAESFEAYLFEGKAPSIELQPLFQKFRAWMLNVYKSLKDFLAKHPEAGRLSDEVRGVFDRMLATNEQIQLAEQGRSMMPLFENAEQAGALGVKIEDWAGYQALGIDATNAAIEELQAKGLRDMQWLHNARGRIIKQLQKESVARRAEVQMEVRREVMSQPIYRAWQFLTGKLTTDDKIAPAERPKSDPDTLDETQDSLFVAIAKLGGINKEEAVSTWGIDPADKLASGVFGKPVWRREGGLSLDGMAEALSQYGYLTVDENGKWDLRELEDRFRTELGGSEQYSTAYDYGYNPGKPGEQVANPAALMAGRFDRASLAELGFPAEIIEHLENLRMVRKAGIHPDVVAEMFGFSSGDELVRRLAAAPTPKEAINARTDEEMLQRYGDLNSPEAIARAADQAIHNDARARFVATEANALAKATGKPKVLTSAARDFARALIARLKVRDIKPGQYAAAEVRAAKAAEKAKSAGDLATAGAEKRNQLVQNYATKAAYDALDEIEKGLRYLKKFDREGSRKGLTADYLDQIDGLLDRFDLRKQSLKAIDKRTSLAEWITAQRNAGMEPDVPVSLENEAFRTSYKNLTVEEFRGLVDTVKQIEHLGRLKKKLLTAKDRREYEAARDEIVEGIEANAGNRTADTRTPTTNMGRAIQGLKRFWASHIKAATWARIMDGGKAGPVWEYFIRTANERGDMETTMRAEATAKLSEILAPVMKLGKMGGKGQFFPSINRSLNRESKLAIALNMGNDGNTQRLLGGEGWSIEQLAPVLQSLTSAEWQAVQAVWDHLESYRPQIAEKERRIYGKEPDWVEPRAFSVTTADGQTVHMRGGYYPIKYDPAASQRAEEHADAEGAKRQLQGAYTTATTRRSFTKSRVEEVAGRPLLYTLSGLYSGVNDVIHDLAWHEWLIDVNRLMRSETIDRAIREHYGPEVKQQFKTWIADVAEGEKGSDNAGEVALGKLRQNVSAAGLGFNLVSAAMQGLGMTQSIVRVGAPWIGRGVKKYMASPIEASKEVREKSDFMANRARTRWRELNELRNKVQDESDIKSALRDGTYFLLMKCQTAVDIPTWIGAYEKAVAEGNDEGRSVALADQAVIDSQGGGQTKDLASIERGGQALRLFTVFYSFMNTSLNLGVAQTMTEKSKAKLAADYLLLYTVPAVLGSLLKDAITPGDAGDDDWDKLAKKMIAEQLSYLMGLMVVVREFGEAAKIMVGAEGGGRDYAGPAGIRFIADFFRFAQQLSQGEADDALRKSAVNMAGDVTGLPSAQINRTITGAKALAEGKTTNPAAVAFGFQEKR